MGLHTTPRESSHGGLSNDSAAGSVLAKLQPRYRVGQAVTEAEISDLAVDWNRLSKSSESPNVFMTYDWFRAWNQRMEREDGRNRRYPNILVLRTGETVAGISPFISRVSTRFGVAVRKIEFLKNYGDYNDLVLGDDSAGQIDAVVGFLARTATQWDVADFRNLRANSVMGSQIESAISRANLFHRILPEQDGCPYLSIDADAATLMNNLSGHVRRTLRKRMERATAEGLHVRIVENPHLEPGLLEEMIALEAKKYNSAGPFIGKYPEVFRSLFDTLGPRGWLYVALLERDNDRVAFQLGFRCGRKLWDYSKAYDRVFSRFAPGSMLVHALLDYGYSRGYEEYDFLQGEEPYKMVWSTGCHRVVRLLIWNRRWTSRSRKFAYCDFKPFVYQLLGKRM